MSEEHNFDSRLERGLDAALQRYSNVTPGPGLETRVLATIREAGIPSRNQLHWLVWLAAPLGVAAAVIFTIQFSRPIPNLPVAKPDGVLATILTTPGPTFQSKKPRIISAKRTSASSGPLMATAAPKLKTFPAPMPLSEQERLLLAYMKHTPRGEILAQSQRDEPPPQEMNELQAPAPATRRVMDTK